MLGTTISHYKISEKIGQGGMGEVYRAEDTNLSREVAIKVLPEQFTQDPQRLARFEREAKLLASLNHPNIAAIYGFEQADDVHFLVLELVPGETLAERVAKGPVPVEEALEFCRQIAEGVEAAHEKGVIHRDLKPANVKVTPEGKVKILDFGLAKAFEADTPVTDISQSPTLTEEMTRAGVILGTAAYMSPEQAKGKPVDKRADIFAFGCVLYELLTGKRAFEGETIAETIAKVLEGEPDWDALPSTTPWRIQELLRRGLTKDPHDRLPHIANFRIEIRLALEDPLTESSIVVGTTVQAPLWRKAIPWTLTLFMGVVAVSLAFWNVAEPAMSPTLGSLTKLTISLSADAPLVNNPANNLAISPDGRRIVYAAQLGSNTQLYLRQLDDVTVTPITGTEGATSAFFSPDGQSVAFPVGGQLKRVPIMGGTPITITDSLPAQGIELKWGPGDTMMFVVGASEGGGLYRVSAAGGEVERLSSPAPERGEVAYRQLEVLPSGNAVLLGVRREDGSFQIIAISLQTEEQEIVVEGGRAPHYTPTGHLVYESELTGTLMAAPFDLESVEVTGNPVPILEGVRQTDCCSVDYALSLEGTLVYVPAGSLRTLVWLDRDGREMEPLTEIRSGYDIPRLSPDGQRLAVQIDEKAESDIWVYDINGGRRIRITAQGLNRFPVWTPDGMGIAFVSNQYNLYRNPADGSGERELLPTGERTRTLFPTSWSPDGQTLAFQQATGGRDIWMLPLKGEASSFLATSFNERAAMFSPDGRWLAYVSNESGRFEVYVQAYPGPGGKWPISIEGGTEPMWSREGRELFYREGSKMMAVAVNTAPTFTADTPRLLFEGPYVLGSQVANYDISLDGQRFLMIKEEGQGSQINVVLNWFEELERLVPTN